MKWHELFFALTILLVVASQVGFAQTETVLYTFTGPDGANPGFANLAIDTKGNLYGTTLEGGAHGYGTVFQVPASGGERLLYSFTGKSDGGDPEAGVLISNGALYGTTRFGGTQSGKCGTHGGCGTIFKVTGVGKESVVYAFVGPNGDGAQPYGALIQDHAGNIYGTTSYGGDQNLGTIFELMRSGKESVLHSFGRSPDGSFPTGVLVGSPNGVIYGTTNSGGVSCAIQGCGTAFELQSGGESVIHLFGQLSTDGVYPWGGLIADSDGNLYGTASAGGKYGYGNVFKLAAGAAWEETDLYDFTGLSDGASPSGTLLRDSHGNLYGTTPGGGAYTCGTVFRLTPDGKETVLYSFKGLSDGDQPSSGVVADKQGNLYGTTTYGGSANYTQGLGVVFKITP
jgi:uncharacterized repeat protein (TIGR03803 family)